ncbi:MAG TPA: hypothetical protein PK829_02595 [Promineifilum sp.]|nr:hypothetical protein [Promineifilum sp.]
MTDQQPPPPPRRRSARRVARKATPTNSPGLGLAALVVLLATLPLLGILYLGAQLLRLPFPPLDLYDWPVRAGFTPWAALVDSLSSPTGNIAETAPLVQWLVGLALFLALAYLVGLAFYAFVMRRGRAPDAIDGLTAGALLAVPMVFVSLAVRSSPLPAPLIIVWLVAALVGWGLLLSYAFGRLLRPAPAVVAPAMLPSEEPVTPIAPAAATTPTPAGIDRRRFLLQFGASTAAITAVTTAAGAALARREDAETLQRTLPMISPEFRAAQQELFGRFRRFAIVRGAADSVDKTNVLALGAEYPDRNYVSIWLGGHSPIVIYENLETALAAYSAEGEQTGLFWLDS